MIKTIWTLKGFEFAFLLAVKTVERKIYQKETNNFYHYHYQSGSLWTFVWH